MNKNVVFLKVLQLWKNQNNPEQILQIKIYLAIKYYKTNKGKR